MKLVLLIMVTNFWLCSAFEETDTSTLSTSSTITSSSTSSETSTPTLSTSTSMSTSSSSWDWGWGEGTTSSFSVSSTEIMTSSSPYSESTSTSSLSTELNPTSTSSASSSSSSEAVDAIEMLFAYLYQALENDREIDHLKKRKRREAEKPGLAKRSDLAFHGEKKRRLGIRRKDDFVKKILRLARKRE